jgi:sugar/nucleoside kinase (ribokinase family)
VVGAASRDLAPDDPRGWRLGGSATYCSLAAARLGLRVGCILGVDAAAAGADELSLLDAAGVELRTCALDRGPVFENIETGGHRRQRWLSRSDAVRLSSLPDEWRGAPAWLMVPVAGEAGDEWARTAPVGAAVGLGWQGLLREFAEDGWVEPVEPKPSPLLTGAGLVVASVDDLGGETAIEQLPRLAPNAAIVLTAGEDGGAALRDGKLSRYQAAPAPGAVDPTGAGDVFLTALMVAWLIKGELATAGALRFAAAAASCAVEGVGLTGVPTRDQVEARLRSPAG